MWCEASLTGFSHMMLYQQAANERKCPGKIQGKCFNYFGTFSKMVDIPLIYRLVGFLFVIFSFKLPSLLITASASAGLLQSVQGKFLVFINNL
jgi:hypothetical protein